MQEREAKKIVLHLLHWPWGGIVSLIRDIVENDDKYEYHVAFLVEGAEAIHAFRELGVAPFVIQHRAKLSYINTLWSFKRILLRIKPDIVHAHSFQPGLLAAVCVSRRTPVIRTFHANYPYFRGYHPVNFIKRLIEGLYLQGKNITCTCVHNSVASSLPWLLKGSRNFVVHNGLNINRIWDLSSEVVEISCRGSKVAFIGVGRLEREKGFDVLINAFAKVLVKCDRELELWLVGEGSQRKTLVSLVDNLGLHDRVKFLGHQKNPYKYMSKASIYISSSRSEGFGLSIAEALVLKIPVVATRTGGLPLDLQDRKTAILCSPNDQLDLERAMLEVLSLPEGERELMGEEGFRFVEGKYELARMIEAYSRIYDESLE